MKNLFIVRLIVIFFFASLIHIDIVNAQDSIIHHTPRKINKDDRKEIDKKLSEFDTLQLRREPLLLYLRSPLYNYRCLYLDKKGRIRKYEYLFLIPYDSEASWDSIVCHYDSDGKLLKYAYEEYDGVGDYFKGGFYDVKNGRIVDYDTYYNASPLGDEGLEKEREKIEKDRYNVIVGDPLGSDSFAYLNTDSLIKYLKCINPDEELYKGYSCKAIDSYSHNRANFSTPFYECDYLSHDKIMIGSSIIPTYDKLNEIIRMPLKKYLLHYEYFTYGDVKSLQERKNISYVYLDSLSRVRKFETMFKEDQQNYGMSCFFNEDGMLLYVNYYNSSESGYFYVKDSLLYGEWEYSSRKNVPDCFWNSVFYENIFYDSDSWTLKHPFKLEDVLKNHEILMFPLSSCLHVTMLPNLAGYYENNEDDKNKKFTLPKYAVPIPLQQPY